MRTDVLQVAKRWAGQLSIADLASGESDSLQSNDLANLTVDEVLTAKIIAVGFLYNTNQPSANSALLSYLPGASSFNIDLIFKKIKLSSPEALAACRKYILIPAHRSVIAELFKKNGLICEEAHVYDISALETFLKNPDSTELAAADISKHRASLFRLFGTINMQEYKITKKDIARLSKYDIREYIPSLTDHGYKNYKGLAGGKLYEQGLRMAGYAHPSEYVRVEYLRTLRSYSEILEYFRYNQYIEESQNQNQMVQNLKIAMRNIQSNGHELESFISEFLTTVVEKMAVSSNFCRRYLGASLLIHCLSSTLIQDTLKFRKYERLINKLAYDKCREIRGLMHPWIDALDYRGVSCIPNLFSHHYYMVLGATCYLRNASPELLFQTLRTILHDYVAPGKELDFEAICAQFANNRTDARMVSAALIQENVTRIVGLPVFGFLHSLIELDYQSAELDTIVNILYQHTLHDESVHGWRTLRECCLYYVKTGNADVLMRTLLKCDHFGILCTLKTSLVLTNECIPDLLKLGIECIRNKTNNTRKSGGLSVFFLKLIQNTENYEMVKHSLMHLIYGTASPDDMSKFVCDEVVLFHCLNIFKSYIEELPCTDLTFFLELALAGLQHPSFNAKNCGCGIFGLWAKKILLAYKKFDNLLAVAPEIRCFLQNSLRKAIKARDVLTAYFVLFVYDKVELISDAEYNIIECCIEIGGFLGLRAKTIRERQRYFQGYSAQKPYAIVFREDASESKILSVLFKILCSNDQLKIAAVKCYIAKHYQIQECSTEYARHRIAQIAYEGGLIHSILLQLQSGSYAAPNQNVPNELFEEEAEGDGDIVAEGIELLSLYATKQLKNW